MVQQCFQAISFMWVAYTQAFQFIHILHFKFFIHNSAFIFYFYSSDIVSSTLVMVQKCFQAVSFRHRLRTFSFFHSSLIFNNSSHILTYFRFQPFTCSTFSLQIWCSYLNLFFLLKDYNNFYIIFFLLFTYYFILVMIQQHFQGIGNFYE